jgi:hypothetical protein
VTAPRIVLVRGKKPLLSVSVKLTKAAKLGLRLLDRKGRVLASWSRSAKAGTTKLKLALPAKARKAGRDTLRVTVAGHAKNVTVTLRA